MALARTSIIKNLLTLFYICLICLADIRFDAIHAKQSAVAAGYNPIVVENPDAYKRLILRVAEKSSLPTTIIDDNDQPYQVKIRRQTPLVNAGYACRVLSISQTIRSFISYHKIMSYQTKNTAQPRKKQIRIVFLGCGVDVIGLWSRSLLSSEDNIDLQIVEIDTAEICSIKRKKILSDPGIISNITEHFHAAIRKTDLRSESECKKRCYYTGKINFPPSIQVSGVNTTHICDYLLIPADLNDTSTMSIIVDIEEENDDDIPTLVVSELVLSYLSPSSTDSLLRWCSENLCKTCDSAFVFLESIGISDSTGSNSGCTISVEEGYRREYCKKFDDKMKRGMHSKRKIQYGNNMSEKDHGKGLYSEQTFFHPIGGSLDDIKSVVHKAGFSGASSATTLGVVASFAVAATSTITAAARKEWICPEIFDEHAALVLHLQSYVLACGLSKHVKKKSDNSEDFSLFRSFLCPWERPNALAFVRAGLPLVDSKKKTTYTEIEINDEGQVRDLFRNSYEKYTDTYTAIRKMIKTVLKNELKETKSTIVMKDKNGVADDNDDSQNSFPSSVISNYYRSFGGIFLVALQYYTDSLSISIHGDDDGNIYQGSVGATNRKVVGCVGIRSCEAKNSERGTTFEVFRLAVRTDHRGQGIAKDLLRAAERYMLEKQRKYHRMKFVANTLTILNEAAGLYEACGYKVEEEKPLGSKLIMRTYTKESATY